MLSSFQLVYFPVHLLHQVLSHRLILHLQPYPKPPLYNLWPYELSLLLWSLYFSKCINSRSFRYDLNGPHFPTLFWIDIHMCSFSIHREPPGGPCSESQPAFPQSEISRNPIDGSSITVDQLFNRRTTVMGLVP